MPSTCPQAASKKRVPPHLCPASQCSGRRSVPLHRTIHSRLGSLFLLRPGVLIIGCMRCTNAVLSSARRCVFGRRRAVARSWARSSARVSGRDGSEDDALVGPQTNIAVRALAAASRPSRERQGPSRIDARPGGVIQRCRDLIGSRCGPRQPCPGTGAARLGRQPRSATRSSRCRARRHRTSGAVAPETVAERWVRAVQQAFKRLVVMIVSGADRCGSDVSGGTHACGHTSCAEDLRLDVSRQVLPPATPCRSRATDHVADQRTATRSGRVP